MYYAVHSIPTYDNPLVVLSVHATLREASDAARAAAERSAREQGSHVEELTELDPLCLATFCALDDAFIVTESVDALFNSRL